MTDTRTKFAKLTELEKTMPSDEFNRLKADVDAEYLAKFKVLLTSTLTHGLCGD